MTHPTLQPQRVAVVLNPIKLDADDARDAVVLACRKGGWADPAFYLTEVDDPGYGMTRRALEHGADVVLAAGGDGTTRAVAEVLAGTGMPLGLVPLGTGNLLARNLGSDLGDPHRCVDVALFGSTRAIDSVELTLERPGGENETKRFVVIAGAGFDAQIMADTRDDLKDKVGWMAYGEAASRHLFRRPGWARYSVDGSPWQSSRTRSAMICNCGELTAGMVLVPDARIDDGLLDLVMMNPRSVLSWAGMAAKVAFTFNHELPSLTYRQGKHVRVEFHQPQEAQIDGDVLGKVLALDAEVHPGSLVVRVPPSHSDEPRVTHDSRPVQWDED